MLDGLLECSSAGQLNKQTVYFSYINTHFYAIYFITKSLTHGIKTILIVRHVMKSNYLPRNGQRKLTEMVN